MIKFVFLILFNLCLVSFANAENIKYKDWEVQEMDGMIFFFTHGAAVHGHTFGFIKEFGNCRDNNFILNFSTTTNEKEKLEALKGETFQIKISYPEKDGVSTVLVPELFFTMNLGTMKLVSFSHNPKNPPVDFLLELYLEKLHDVVVDIEPPYTELFDIPSDEFSLNGYIAAKLKAWEMCEILSKGGSYL